MSTAVRQANEKPEPRVASPWGQDSGLTLVAGSGFEPLTSGL